MVVDCKCNIQTRKRKTEPLQNQQHATLIAEGSNLAWSLLSAYTPSNNDLICDLSIVNGK